MIPPRTDVAVPFTILSSPSGNIPAGVDVTQNHECDQRDEEAGSK